MVQEEEDPFPPDEAPTRPNGKLVGFDKGAKYRHETARFLAARLRPRRRRNLVSGVVLFVAVTLTVWLLAHC